MATSYSDIMAAANAICEAQPGYGTPSYRGDPLDAVALQQQASRLLDDTARRLVAHEVRYCVSALVGDLMRDEHGAWAKYEDELTALAERAPDADDYREYASYADADDTRSLKVEALATGGFVWAIIGEAHSESDTFATELDAWEAAFATTNDAGEVRGSDCLEHWLVTDWLAEKLEAEGEAVAHDVAGLTIWGRCTSGQAIYADAVFQRIARNVLEA